MVRSALQVLGCPHGATPSGTKAKVKTPRGVDCCLLAVYLKLPEPVSSSMNSGMSNYLKGHQED